MRAAMAFRSIFVGSSSLRWWGRPHESIEAQFLQQYRRAALRGMVSASLAGAYSFLAFLFVARYTEGVSALGLWVRVFLILILLVTVWLVVRAPRFAERNYVPIAGGVSSTVLGGTVLLLSLGAAPSMQDGGGGSPAHIFGLFLHYSFLRLPLWCAAGIGWSVSVASVLWAQPLVVTGNAEARTIIYLVLVNLVGMAVCRSIESRERELFFQRRRAEAAQAELKERARAAEEAHMEKTRLLAAVSHDLRQPMMATTAYLSVLKSRIQRGDLEQAEKQLSNISESIGMLGATLDHLLTAARYDSGTEPINVESVELRPILERLHSTFANEAAIKGIELRIRCPRARLVVSTDATALWRVLMNLVSNAIKFTEANSHPGRGVLVRCTLLDKTVRIDVADTGVGISGEFQNAIWQPYFQVANAERNRAYGLGLGLFLVRRAVDHLPEHRLAMRSRLGRGSRFSVFLPGSRLSAPDVGRTEPPPISDRDLGILAGAYVLVIEDDLQARRAMCALLEDWGVVYSSGATLEEALIDMASSPRTVDAVISDYRLPGARNGVECIAELRQLFADAIPAVIVTGEVDLATIRAAMLPDMTLLQKPFDPPELLAPLRAAVLRARSRELE